MKIVHVGGKDGCVRTRRAARAQREAGHDVVLVQGEKFSLEDHVLLPGPAVDGFKRYQINLQRPAWLRDALIELAPDVLHVHELDYLFLVTALWTSEVNERLLDNEPYHLAGFEFAKMPMPVIYDSHEYEQGRPYVWKTAFDDALRAWQERCGIRYVDHVIAPSNAIASRLRSDYFLSTYPTTVLNSPPSPRGLVAAHRQEIRDSFLLKEGERAIVFAGYFTRDRMLRQLGRAFQMLGKGWRLFLMGKRGSDKNLEMELESFGAEFVGNLPYPWPEAQDAGLTLYDGIAACDVAFSCSDVRAYPNWKLGAPNKFFEYAMAGVPQVLSDAIDPGGWVYRYQTETHGVGVLCDNSVRGIARAIEEAASIKVDQDLMVQQFAYDLTQVANLETAYIIAKTQFALAKEWADPPRESPIEPIKDAV